MPKLLNGRYVLTNTGSTLIEVILATAVIVLVLVAIVSTLSLTQRNQRVSGSEEQATKYSQEAVEWMRKVRDTLGWQSFYDTVSADGASSTHCIPTIPAATDGPSYTGLSDIACTSSSYITDGSNTFTRQVVITVTNTETIQIDSTVNWVDGTRNLSTANTVILTKWK